MFAIVVVSGPAGAKKRVMYGPYDDSSQAALELVSSGWKPFGDHINSDVCQFQARVNVSNDIDPKLEAVVAYIVPIPEPKLLPPTQLPKTL